VEQLFVQMPLAVVKATTIFVDKMELGLIWEQLVSPKIAIFKVEQ